jgi:hypothetical protein
LIITNPFSPTLKSLLSQNSISKITALWQLHFCVGNDSFDAKNLIAQLSSLDALLALFYIVDAA